MHCAFTTARLHMPLYDNSGNSVEPAVESASLDLLEAFGGVTFTKGWGMWRDDTGRVYRDNLLIADVATTWDNEARAKLRTIAAHYGAEAGQKSVYVSFPESVEFVPPAVAKVTPRIAAG